MEDITRRTFLGTAAAAGAVAALGMEAAAPKAAQADPAFEDAPGVAPPRISMLLLGALTLLRP